MNFFITTLLMLNLMIFVGCKNNPENERVEPEIQTQTESVLTEGLNTYAVIPKEVE